MNTQSITSSPSSRGSFGSLAVRLGFSLLLVIGPIGAAMSGARAYQTGEHGSLLELKWTTLSK